MKRKQGSGGSNMGVRNKKYSMFPPMCGIYIQQYMYIYDIKQKVTFFKEEGHQQGENEASRVNVSQV